MHPNDRVAMVTGAARGIGFGVAARLHASGAAVCMIDLDGEGAKAAALRLDPAGTRAIGFGADVASSEAVQSAVAEVIDRFGKIDILVTAAGIFPSCPFDELGFEQWRSVMSVNLDGTFLSCRAVYPHMRKQGHGRIITIASATVNKGNVGFAAYASSKGGVIALTRVIANEGGPHGITANAIAPGIIATEGVTGQTHGKAILDAIVAAQPIKRNGEPSDVAAAVAYLSSPDASFVTGQIINVNGGSIFV
jgi:NAD(P)-dependent dehydrogenase (short-subunit alcohol dehydrogenase family)